MDYQWCFSIFGLTLTDPFDEGDYGCSELWNTMVWPAGEEEVFNFKGKLCSIFVFWYLYTNNLTIYILRMFNAVK